MAQPPPRRAVRLQRELVPGVPDRTREAQCDSRLPALGELARRRPADDRVVMEHTLHPRAGYPFALRVEVEYRVGADGLSSTVTATNVGDRACPYGMGAIRTSGWRRTPSSSAGWRRRAAAPRRGRPGDPGGTAGGGRDEVRLPRASADPRYRAGHRLHRLDRDRSGRAWVRLWRGREDHGVGLWMDERYPYYMLYTGDTLPERARRRRSIGVEPMTCAPNAFASGDGLISAVSGRGSGQPMGRHTLGATS